MGLTFPHCDARVLHAPGVCDICDECSKTLQEIRECWGINFTRQHFKNLVPCPGEAARGMKSINSWPGNRPWKYKNIEGQK